MNKQMAELLGSAPKVLQEATTRMAVAYQEMMAADKQRVAWAKKAEATKLAFEAAQKEQVELLTRWDGISKEIEPLKLAK